jgi:hypothetical protein
MIHPDFQTVGNCVFRSQFQRHNLKGKIASKVSAQSTIVVVFDGKRQAFSSMPEATQFAYGKGKVCSTVWVESNNDKRVIKGTLVY